MLVARSPEKGKCKPLKVTIGNLTLVSDIFKKSEVLRDTDKSDKVFVSPARSKVERVERKKLVLKLKQKRAENRNKRTFLC